MSRTKLSRAAGVALATGALALAGCGVNGGGSGTLAGGTGQKVEAGSFEGAGGATFLKKAASATSDATTMHEHLTITTDGSGLDLSMTADGAFDNTTGRGRFSMSVPDLPAGGNLEMVIDGDTVYMKMPMMGASAKPWVKLDMADLGKAGTTGAAGDPGAFLKMLEGTGAEITTLGKEDQRGVSTTHISTTLDLRKLMATAAGKDKAALQEQLDSLGGVALPAVPAEVWIDDDGYVRKLSLDMDLSKVAGTSGIAGRLNVTVELYDFGEPVDVEVPDPSQVGELGSGLLGGN